MELSQSVLWQFLGNSGSGFFFYFSISSILSIFNFSRTKSHIWLNFLSNMFITQKCIFCSQQPQLRMTLIYHIFIIHTNLLRKLAEQPYISSKWWIFCDLLELQILSWYTLSGIDKRMIEYQKFEIFFNDRGWKTLRCLKHLHT